MLKLPFQNNLQMLYVKSLFHGGRVPEHAGYKRAAHSLSLQAETVLPL